MATNQQTAALYFTRGYGCFCGGGNDHKYSGAGICPWGYRRQGSDLGAEGGHNTGHRDFLMDSYHPAAEQLGGLGDRSHQ